MFVPFMGVSAATITGTSRLARLTGARVVPFTLARTDDSGTYLIRLQPALSDFPSDSDEQDCRRINEIIETQVKQYPEQYWWMHRRFKTRPEGEERPY